MGGGGVVATSCLAVSSGSDESRRKISFRHPSLPEQVAKRTDWAGSVPPSWPLRGVGWVSRPRHAQHRGVLRSRLSPEVWVPDMDIVPTGDPPAPGPTGEDVCSRAGLLVWPRRCFLSPSLCHSGSTLTPGLLCRCSLDKPYGGGPAAERALALGERPAPCWGRCPGRRVSGSRLAFPEPQLLYL